MEDRGWEIVEESIVLGSIECWEGLSVGSDFMLERVECWEGLSVGKG